MDNKILEALSQVPELVEATETTNKINQEQSQRLAEIAQRNVHADIPGSEIGKVTKAVEATVKSTQCALPYKLLKAFFHASKIRLKMLWKKKSELRQ